MGRVCSLCRRSDRTEIDDALLAGAAPLWRIAAAYDTSESALRRHEKRCLRERLEAAKMLDAEALARRMAQLDNHVDAVLEAAGRDRRLALLAVAEGRRNVDTLMRLLVVHAAERRNAQSTVTAEGYSAPVFNDDPETIRTVLKMLIESGAAALPAPTGDDQQPPGEQETTG